MSGYKQPIRDCRRYGRLCGEADRWNVVVDGMLKRIAENQFIILAN